MFTTTKLIDHPYAQASIRLYDSGEIVFISYSTPVIIVSSDGWMRCTGTYSQTTRKQIGWFMRERFPRLSYHTAKRLYIDNMEMNIHTGEVRPL